MSLNFLQIIFSMTLVIWDIIIMGLVSSSLAYGKQFLVRMLNLDSDK